MRLPYTALEIHNCGPLALAKLVTSLEAIAKKIKIDNPEVALISAHMSASTLGTCNFNKKEEENDGLL